MSGHIDRAQQELASAPLLFSDLPESVRTAVEAQEAKGEWTGERLFQRNPELYMVIVRMLGLDMPVQGIARVAAVSDNTVRAVRERESAAIADFRAKQGVRRRKAMDLALDQIIAKLPTAGVKDAVIAYGILDDKERLDSGAPTQRIEITHAPASSVYEEFVKQIIDVEAETLPATGWGGVEGGQMGAGLAGGGQVVELEDSRTADVTSDGLQRTESDTTALATGALDATGCQGGEGVEGSAAGGARGTGEAVSGISQRAK